MMDGGIVSPAFNARILIAQYYFTDRDIVIKTIFQLFCDFCEETQWIEGQACRNGIKAANLTRPGAPVSARQIRCGRAMLAST